MRYEAFEIRILPAAAGGYEVEVQSPAGEGRGRFELPFSFDQIEIFSGDPGAPDLRGIEAGEGPGRGVVLLAEGGAWPARSPRETGEALFRALFTSEIQRRLDASLEGVQKRGHGLEIRLSFDLTEPAQARLSSLPWELLYRAETGEYLSCSELTPVVRQLAGEPVRKFELPRVLRILMVVSKPSDRPRLALEQEVAEVVESWNQDNVEVTVLTRGEGKSLGRELRDTLHRGDFHVLHFMGHGEFDAATREGVLCFEDREGCAERVPGQVLASWLRNSRSLRLVILNACSTARSAAGVAAALVRGGVPGVLAMRDVVPDPLSIELSRVLYSRLASGKPLEAALAAARHEVHELEREGGSEDPGLWASPVLLTRGEPFQVPERPWRTLANLWTALGLALLYFSTNSCLRTITSPFALPGIDFRDTDTYVVSIFGILIGFPLLALILYVTNQYQKGFREPGLLHRLPVAFNLPIHGRRVAARIYQVLFLVLFLVYPMTVQAVLYAKLIKGTTFQNNEAGEDCKRFHNGAQGEPYASRWEHFTQYQPPSVLVTDCFRYGSTGKGVTFLPFWQPWGFLVIELALLYYLGVVVWRLLRRD